MNTDWLPFDPKEIKVDVVKLWDFEKRVAIEVPVPIANQVLATNSKRGEQSFGDDELQKMLLEFCIKEGLKQLDWRPIWPVVQDVDSADPVLQKDHSFCFVLNIDHHPEIDWPDFKSLEIIRPVRVISDDLVAAEMREQCLVAGPSENVESQFEVGDEIHAEVELHESTGQSLLGAFETTFLVLESDAQLVIKNLRFDDFFSDLKKSVVGDKIVSRTTPTVQYSDTELSSQEIQATFRIVKAIRRTPLAIKDVLEQYGTPNEFVFKKQIRLALESAVERDQKSAITTQIYNALFDKVKDQLGVPTRVSHHVKDDMVMQERKKLEAKGCTDEQVEAELDSHSEKLDAWVLRQLQQQVLISKLAIHLGLGLNEDDVMRWVADKASEEGRRPEEVRMELKNSGQFMRVTLSILERQVCTNLLAREMIVLTDMDADEWIKKKAEQSHEDDG